MDEVKYHKGKEPYYWLCGLCFPEDSIKDIEQQLSTIAKEYFGSGVLDKATEFHAKDIAHGSGPYKGHNLTDRFNLFISLLDTLESCQNLKKIVVRIEPARMIKAEHHDMAFMFFVEKVEHLMMQLKSNALLIIDHDKDIVSSNVSSLSAYKEHGTQYAFASSIEHIVDTIHHTHSHHSRLIQMADIFTYTTALSKKAGMKFPRQAILTHAKENTSLLSASKYKYWPTEHSYIQA
jgi:hypothetical protein